MSCHRPAKLCRSVLHPDRSSDEVSPEVQHRNRRHAAALPRRLQISNPLHVQSLLIFGKLADSTLVVLLHAPENARSERHVVNDVASKGIPYIGSRGAILENVHATTDQDALQHWMSSSDPVRRAVADSRASRLGCVFNWGPSSRENRPLGRTGGSRREDDESRAAVI